MRRNLFCFADAWRVIHASLHLWPLAISRSPRLAQQKLELLRTLDGVGFHLAC